MEKQLLYQKILFEIQQNPRPHSKIISFQPETNFTNGNFCIPFKYVQRKSAYARNNKKMRSAFGII